MVCDVDGSGQGHGTGGEAMSADLSPHRGGDLGGPQVIELVARMELRHTATHTGLSCSLRDERSGDDDLAYDDDISENVKRNNDGIGDDDVNDYDDESVGHNADEDMTCCKSVNISQVACVGRHRMDTDDDIDNDVRDDDIPDHVQENHNENIRNTRVENTEFRHSMERSGPTAYHGYYNDEGDTEDDTSDNDDGNPDDNNDVDDESNISVEKQKPRYYCHAAGGEFALCRWRVRGVKESPGVDGRERTDCPWFGLNGRCHRDPVSRREAGAGGCGTQGHRSQSNKEGMEQGKRGTDLHAGIHSADEKLPAVDIPLQLDSRPSHFTVCLDPTGTGQTRLDDGLLHCHSSLLRWEHEHGLRGHSGVGVVKRNGRHQETDTHLRHKDVREVHYNHQDSDTHLRHKETDIFRDTRPHHQETDTINDSRSRIQASDTDKITRHPYQRQLPPGKHSNESATTRHSPPSLTRSKTSAATTFLLLLVSLLHLSHLATARVYHKQMSPRVISTRYGKVRGVLVEFPNDHLKPVEAFFGLKYADLERGNMRFMPPKNPKEQWTSIRVAIAQRPACPQLLQQEKEYQDAVSAGRVRHVQNFTRFVEEQIEDCLTLNLYVPIPSEWSSRFSV